jgi:hypothetical protein
MNDVTENAFVAAEECMGTLQKKRNAKYAKQWVWICALVMTAAVLALLVSFHENSMRVKRKLKASSQG